MSERMPNRIDSCRELGASSNRVVIVYVGNGDMTAPKPEVCAGFDQAVEYAIGCMERGIRHQPGAPEAIQDCAAYIDQQSSIARYQFLQKIGELAGMTALLEARKINPEPDHMGNGYAQNGNALSHEPAGMVIGDRAPDLDPELFTEMGFREPLEIQDYEDGANLGGSMRP